MKNIGIYDSGCGGISIVNQLIKSKFNGNIYYYADSLNNPWGNKTKEELEDILTGISKWFESKKLDYIITGCNTTYSIFKDKLNIIFNQDEVFNILTNTNSSYSKSYYSVLCTENSYQYSLFSNFLNSKNIQEVACPNLASLIEKNQLNDSLTCISNYIKDCIYKNIILGCTHYSLLIENLTQIYPEKNFIDPSEYFIKHHQYFHNNNNNQTIYFYISGNESLFVKNINKHLLTSQFVIEKKIEKIFTP